jgi:hypothetical protein
MLLDILVFPMTTSYCTGMEKDNDMLLDMLVFFSDNIILYRYVLMEMDNNMLLDILVFLMTTSYWTGIY